MNDTTYNGWKNRQTWNVALWISNDEPLYRAAVEFMSEKLPQRTYKEFIDVYMGLGKAKTPDGIHWISEALDYTALNEMMRDLID